jgi:caffeoyl-CoA O-methyltransferase
VQRKSVEVTPELHAYVVEHSGPIERHHRALMAETEYAFPERAGMQVPPEEGVLLRILVQVTGARRVLEVGTFTGLSAMFIAEGLPPDGELVCLDVSEEYTAVARRHWRAAGLEDKIDLRIGPALATLEGLAGGPSFDMAFVDADKPPYADYFEAVLPMVRSGGLLVFDNTLRGGRVVDAHDSSEDVLGMRRFNDAVASDDRIEVALLAFADGLTVIRRR